jgi:hypothetical protein
MRWRRQQLKQRLDLKHSSFLLLLTVNIVFLIDPTVSLYTNFGDYHQDPSVEENPATSELNKMGEEMRHYHLRI